MVAPLRSLRFAALKTTFILLRGGKARTLEPQKDDDHDTANGHPF